jgi:hypothetical protein
VTASNPNFHHADPAPADADRRARVDARLVQLYRATDAAKGVRRLIEWDRSQRRMVLRPANPNPAN